MNKNIYRNWTLLFLILLITLIGNGQEDFLGQYQWKNRIILIFSPTVQNVSLQAQKIEFTSYLKQFLERDLIQLEVLPDRMINSQSEAVNLFHHAILRKKYDVAEDEYKFILIGKDGGVKFNSDRFVTREDLFSLIDAMPMRKREMRIKNQ